MFDLKVINSVLEELQETKNISKDEVIDAIEETLAAAYKKQYGERGQVVKAKLNMDTGNVDFFRIKEVVSDNEVIPEDELEKMDKEQYLAEKEKGRTKFIDQKHIMLDSAKMIKADAKVGDEIVFDLENKTDFGRVAAMAAKQTIRQKIRQAEMGHIQEEFGDKEFEIVQGEVLKQEGGFVYVDLGKAEAVMPASEQLPKEKYKTGDKIKALLLKQKNRDEGKLSLMVSRTHPEFLRKLFEIEIPELKEGIVEIKKIVRDPGFRAKVAVVSHDEDLDAVGTFIGQGGSRVMAVSNELSGERIDLVEYSEDEVEYAKNAMMPAEIESVELEGDDKVIVNVLSENFTSTIGRNGQNVKLASRLLSKRIDVLKIDQDQESQDKEEEPKKELENEVEETKTEDEVKEEKEVVETTEEKKDKEEPKENQEQDKEEKTKTEE
ncbi:transcription termination factor NusA [Candidatus Campbellbacteria bacterium]|nr:MAG: transcription termination factor NusA [Candidatus Campbellbacteria bacterium]